MFIILCNFRPKILYKKFNYLLHLNFVCKGKTGTQHPANNKIMPNPENIMTGECQKLTPGQGYRPRINTGRTYGPLNSSNLSLKKSKAHRGTKGPDVQGEGTCLEDARRTFIKKYKKFIQKT